MKRLLLVGGLGIALLTPLTVYAANKIVSKKTAKTQSKINIKSTSKKSQDLNCKDFKSWDQAQKTFLQNGGTKNDIYDLDRDHDGIACEELQNK